MTDYNPHDWFWIVGGDEKRFWSSAAGAYVETLPEDAGITRIANEQELTDVLFAYQLPGPIFRFPELEPYQWDAILDIAGLRPVAEAAVAALPEPDKTVARARMSKSLKYVRHDTLLVGLTVDANLPEAEVDSLWMWAADL